MEQLCDNQPSIIKYMYVECIQNHWDLFLVTFGTISKLPLPEHFNYLFWSSFPCLPHVLDTILALWLFSCDFRPYFFFFFFFFFCRKTLQVTSSLATPARLPSSLHTHIKQKPNNQPMSMVVCNRSFDPTPRPPPPPAFSHQENMTVKCIPP